MFVKERIEPGLLGEIVLQMEISAEFTCAFVNLRDNEICRLNELVPDQEISRLVDSGHLHLIPALCSQDWYLWMNSFAQTVKNPRDRAELEFALDGISAIWKFRNILYRNDDLCEKWESYKEQRLRDCAQEWLSSIAS